VLRYQQDELDMGSLISREDMRDCINQADTIISAVLEYNESELDACIDNIPYIYAECEDPIAAMNNFCWLTFALLDSRMGNKKYDFQNLWYSSVGTRFDAFDEDTKKKIKDVLEKCMLVIMEKRGYHKKHVISYMKLYMYQYYAKDLSLSWFADQLFINTAYLGQKFKKETGESVNSFLHKIRIAKAKELSKKTNMTWREIADAVGYKSYLGFFEHFMKIEGIAPSDYRI